MSLRTEIQEAIDEVTPQSPRLEWKVEAFVESTSRARPRAIRIAWTRPLRGSLALVAAGLLIALVAGLILAGRAWRDLNAPPATVNATELRSLENRALNFPVVAAGSPCPSTPVSLHDLGLGVGDKPFYMVNVDTWANTDWGVWVAVSFAYHNTQPGPVLIRMKDLKSQQTSVVLAQYPLGPSSLTATGRLLGTAKVLNRTFELRPEAVMQDPRYTDPVRNGPRLKVMLGMPQGGSGCIGVQADGPSFTANFVHDFSTSWSLS